MYSITYELPSEDTLKSLPTKTLQHIAEKNSLKTYGSKQSIIHRLLTYWNSMKDTFTNQSSQTDPRDSFEFIEVTSRGKHQSSFSFFSVSDKLCVPVFDHDYQESKYS